VKLGGRPKEHSADRPSHLRLVDAMDPEETVDDSALEKHDELSPEDFVDRAWRVYEREARQLFGGQPHVFGRWNGFDDVEIRRILNETMCLIREGVSPIEALSQASKPFDGDEDAPVDLYGSTPWGKGLGTGDDAGRARRDAAIVRYLEATGDSAAQATLRALQLTGEGVAPSPPAAPPMRPQRSRRVRQSVGSPASHPGIEDSRPRRGFGERGIDLDVGAVRCGPTQTSLPVRGPGETGTSFGGNTSPTSLPRSADPISTRVRHGTEGRRLDSSGGDSPKQQNATGIAKPRTSTHERSPAKQGTDPGPTPGVQTSNSRVGRQKRQETPNLPSIHLSEEISGRAEPSSGNRFDAGSASGASGFSHQATGPPDLRSRFIKWLTQTGGATRLQIRNSGIFPIDSLDMHLHALKSQGRIDRDSRRVYRALLQKPRRWTMPYDPNAEKRRKLFFEALAKQPMNLDELMALGIFDNRRQAGNLCTNQARSGALTRDADGRYHVVTVKPKAPDSSRKRMTARRAVARVAKPKPVDKVPIAVELPDAPARKGKHGPTVDALLDERMTRVASIASEVEQVTKIDDVIRMLVAS
jgi:hypothetical protein